MDQPADGNPFKTVFDGRELRDALGFFATGVAVVSCVGENGEHLASTVSSFNSVSLDPPLVLFSLARSAKSLPDWLKARHYAVSILHGDQAELSNRFARSSPDKWKDIYGQNGIATAVPMIPNALAWFECESYATYDGGDHVILVGKVLSLHRRTHADSSPLVFFRGRYRKLARESEGLPVDEGLWLHGW
jgi:flavin reductase (DIM6/NTAB) family NADH-FMN oxidoreductase RutF